jgi:spore maturation protein CgeB
MKILYHIPYTETTRAERWIYEGWKNAWQELNHQFYEFKDGDNLAKKVDKIKPDIFWTAHNLINIANEKQKNLLKKIRQKGPKIFFMVDGSLSNKEIEIIKNEEIADIYFGERELDSIKKFKELTGKKYYLIPNAADKKYHFPVSSIKKYEYDIVYLGAKLPKKKWFFDNVLIPLTKKCKVGIFGPYWTTKDNLLRAAQKICKKIKFSAGVNFLNSFRIVIPSEEENLLYSSAKISLNFHEREPDGSQPHHILNQRTFKIPACGGFQICDYVPALQKYFTENEVVTAQLSTTDWFKKIDYYLTHDKERIKIQKAGTERALRDHTYLNRVKQVIGLYENI